MLRCCCTSPRGILGEDRAGNGGDLGLPHMFAHILGFYASCELV